ncbi:DUF4190 domain-containing protein [Arthrobacter sp. ERGS1:01]|uniref:DUF4190 domain-containing protein n=1 Tax=Arthrobacter sp. ERGS1:01 TaxID=1704044 RepID=UPI0006B64A98|nr:DUF4190 domain-containing protein [Arthrobacter sp. ERGS1:01]
MSNQPDQPQQYSGTPPDHTPPSYAPQPATPPAGSENPAGGQNPYGQNAYGQNAAQNYGQSPYGQNPYGQNPYSAPQTGQFTAPQFAAPTYYQGGPGYVDATSGPRGLSLASMIIGLGSLFLAGWLIIPQIVGIVLGHVALKKESPQGNPFSITGLITNYLALLIYIGIYAFVIFALMTMGDFSNGSEATWSARR